MICGNCGHEGQLVYLESTDYICSSCCAIDGKKENFQLTPEQAKNLYEWIAREFVPYDNYLLHDTIKQLRYYVEKNELAKRDS